MNAHPEARRGVGDRRTIILAFPTGLLDGVPSLTAAVAVFREEGHRVAVICSAEQGYRRPPAIKGVDYCWLRAPAELQTWVVRVREAIRWRAWALALLRHGRPALAIGVEPEGLQLVGRIGPWLRAPLAYWSLEILFEDEIVDASDRARKVAECRVAPRVEHLLVQDAEREAALRGEVALPRARTWLVPNSPAGEAKARRSRLLRDALGIPDGKRIILFAGTIEPFACVEELAESTTAWPDEWVLVIHSGRALAGGPYLERVRKLASPGRVLLSELPLLSGRYADLVASADVGVACYQELPSSIYDQKNLRQIGLSSGKVAHYLHEGVPVIHNMTGPADQVMRRHGCAERIDDPRRTVDAIRMVLSDYDRRVRGAVSCFNEHWRSDLPLRQLSESLRR